MDRTRKSEIDEERRPEDAKVYSLNDALLVDHAGIVQLQDHGENKKLAASSEAKA